MFTSVNLLSLDLNLLLVFDAVVEERSVARAAKRLHVTPPAISNALTRLRDTLGDPIVTRSGRGIVPTPRALKLAPVIAKALRDVGTAIHGEAFDPLTTQTVFTLATADAAQIARLPQITSALSIAMPNAKLRVVDVATMVNLGGLASTEVDVAIGVSDVAPGIHRHAIYAEHSVVVASRNHPRVGPRVTKKMLQAEQHVEVHVAFGKPSRVVERAYAEQGVERNIVVTVPTFTAAASVVAATEMIATLPRSVVSALAPAFGLRVAASPLRVAPSPMHMSWHERTHADPGMKLFREIVARAAWSAD